MAMTLKRQKILGQMINRKPIDINRYECKVCGKKFHSPVEVRHHMNKEGCSNESVGPENKTDGSVRSSVNKRRVVLQQDN